MLTMAKKIFVSGCFDLLHSGHIAFLKNAAEYGELYVSIGSDETIINLKNKRPTYTQEERLYLIRELKCVKEAFIAKGSGVLDFKEEIKKIRPDIFFVNSDGYSEEKAKLCRELNIDLLISTRIPFSGLPIRSSTTINEKLKIPYRLDLAGGWLDQPFVSKHFSGPVINISIEPSHDFNFRSGMSTSTREKAMKIWGNRLPHEDEESAKTLFGSENPPGTKEIAGSQDALGIVLPGLKNLYYEGEYWPSSITSVQDREILDWLESKIYLIPLEPRKGEFNVLGETNIDRKNAQELSISAEECFNSIIAKDIDMFGQSVKRSFEAQIRMFPRMIDERIIEKIKEYQDVAKGWKLSGAGGGGYLVLISDEPIKNSIQIKIKRKREF